MIDLDPVRGHEQAGRRPALVLSADTWNAGPGRLVTVLPITSKERTNIPSRIAVRPPEGGLTVPSWVIGEQVRTISADRVGRRLGVVRPVTLRAVEDVVRMLLGL
ncbi:MAG: type II toxin-antitoxin system PemK/MazF family toxin [Labilithrix sp.]|nr:type II toxin-antitoxin system PemK/MazF family toxin [Labilithrix sp.]MCW5817328.1 type II toxin-antitoxin system PemK/MazF family toxin [Labilithrix sp.]